MAARLYNKQREESPGGAAPSLARGQGGAVTSDPNLVSKLEADGWLEHTVEKG